MDVAYIKYFTVKYCGLVYFAASVLASCCHFFIACDVR